MLKSIPIANLRPGMFLVEYGAGTFENPVVRPNRLLRGEEEVAGLVREGVGCVLIDLERSLGEPGEAEPAGRGSVPFAEEIAVASRTYTRALTVMHAFFEAVRKGGAPDLSGPESLAGDLAASLARNSRAALSLTSLKRRGHLHVHSVNTAVVAASLALHQGCPPAQARSLILAGLLHDLGMARVSEAVLARRGRLTPGEMAVVRRHPVEGLTLLRDCPGLSSSLLRTMTEHHERFDGAGYPGNIPFERQCPSSRLLALADVYAAMTAERPYRGALLPREALKRLYALKDRDFHAEDLAQFIRCMGIFPAGSFVRLTDGRYAVVTDVDPDKPLFPTVKVSFDHRMRPVRPEILNLSVVAAQGGPGVQDCLDPRENGLDLARLLF